MVHAGGGTHRSRPTSQKRWCCVVPQHVTEGRRPPPADGVGTAAFGFAGNCAICGWRFGTTGDFAPCAARVFRPLRRAGISPAAAGDRGSAPGPRDLGCPPPVGKSGRRGILRQGKVWFRSHTGCMARSRTAAMAEKARRAPQTHGWWAVLIRKKSSKTFIFFTAILRQFRFI